jgi:pyridoxine 5-phosphate synthase
MLKLGVNVDHVATLRQARAGVFPDPVEAALICQKAGAHSIVMHLREDRRHIQDDDVFRAKKKLKIKFNLEMSIAPEIVDIALRVRPDQVTLVPERRQERTTEGGLDLYKKRAWLARCVERFRKKRIDVSFFIDPDDKQIVEARRLGVGAIELHTGDYANARTVSEVRKEWDRLYRAAIFARQLGLVTHAGHGLDLKNVGAMKKIKGLEELNIGYSIVTRAVWVGLEQAVKEMLKAIR